MIQPYSVFFPLPSTTLFASLKSSVYANKVSAAQKLMHATSLTSQDLESTSELLLPVNCLPCCTANAIVLLCHSLPPVRSYISFHPFIINRPSPLLCTPFRKGQFSACLKEAAAQLDIQAHAVKPCFEKRIQSAQHSPQLFRESFPPIKCYDCR